ncbi:MAG: sulfatase-like hydrolase/transferase [Chitinivibrionales bacterium]|nr:sulfatase-like hydrolase/transferase [Chitinivibrionales bacterium]
MMKHTTEIHRREFLRVIGKSGLALCAAPHILRRAVMTSAAPNSRQPNIILICPDDLGYGDLGCYGQQRIETPSVDKMASEGMRFTQFYAGTTVCAPSRCTLLSGLHTGHCLVRDNIEIDGGQMPLTPETVTIAEVLKTAGYETGCIGKWGLGPLDSTGDPNNQGFDYFCGYYNQAFVHNHYHDFVYRNGERIDLGQDRYQDDLFTEEALSFIERNADKPFFLDLAFTIPHAKMQVPDIGKYATESWPDNEKKFAAMVTRMDANVGTILQKLRSLGIDQKTLVIFASDNGPHREGGHSSGFFDSNGPLRGIKRDLYDGGIRVPMIAWWPGTVAAGSTSHHIGYFPDYFVTFMELAGLSAVPEKLDGISMVSELTGDTVHQKQHEYLYWEWQDDVAVRVGKWKNVNGALYDLETDIGETRNIAADHPDIMAQMERIKQEAHTDVVVPDFSATGIGRGGLRSRNGSAHQNATASKLRLSISSRSNSRAVKEGLYDISGKKKAKYGAHGAYVTGPD